MQWSDDLLAVRPALLEWTLGRVAARLATPGERLSGLWQEIHRLLPDLREDIFAAYCRSVFVEKSRPGSTDFVVRLDLWQNLLADRSDPLPEQLEGAAAVTGVPVSWLRDGVTAASFDITTDDLSRLAAFLKERRLTVDAAIRQLETVGT
jgi:hypothetical protein